MNALDTIQRVLTTLPVRGKGRFADYLLARPGHEELICRPLPKVTVHLLRSQRIERLMWAGAYEPQTVRFLKRRIRPATVVVDVGANIGYLSAIAAGLTSAAVFAFEPNAHCFQRLSQNLARFPHAKPIPLALGDAVGTLPLYIDAEEHGFGSFSALEGRQSAVAQVTTLDSFCQKENVEAVGLVKIDVEGWELHVLRGAKGVIGRDRPIVIAEANEMCLRRAGSNVSELITFLTSLNYRIRFLDGDNVCAEP
jgi:FkbM family methyltransferase